MADIGTEISIRKCGYPPQNRARIYADLIAVFRKVPTLHIALVTAVNDTRICSLCAMEGTVPVSYQRRAIQVPLRIVASELYPDQAPICSLIPTDNLSIVSSRLLDSDLRIRHPALQNWSPASSLTDFLHVLTQTFTKQCPIQPSLSLPNTVSVNRINEKIRGKIASLTQEGNRDVAGLTHTKKVLTLRSQELVQVMDKFRETNERLRGKNDDMRKKLEEIKEIVRVKVWISTEKERFHELKPSSKLHSGLLTSVSRAQAVEDTLQLMERRMRDKKNVELRDLRMYRELAHEGFLHSKRAEVLSLKVSTPPDSLSPKEAS